MKTYLSRKNARVAAQKAGENMPDVSVHEITERNFEKLGVKESEIGRFAYTVRPLSAGPTKEEDRETREFIRKFEPAPVSKWDRDEPDPDVVVIDDITGKAEAIIEEVMQNSLRANLDKSVIPNPVKNVHDICNSMPDARRKDVVAACVAAGIALNTARTQYQVWFKNRRKG